MPARSQRGMGPEVLVVLRWKWRVQRGALWPGGSLGKETVMEALSPWIVGVESSGMKSRQVQAGEEVRTERKSGVTWPQRLMRLSGVRVFLRVWARASGVGASEMAWRRAVASSVGVVEEEGR